MSGIQGRILIVDDEEETAQAPGRVVHREGVTPQLTKNGTAALQLGCAGDPDVLRVTLRMPGMDVMELMRKGEDN